MKKTKIPDDCMPKCETCAFAVIEAAYGAGSCHRFPPIFAADDEGSGFTFPGIAPLDWCGEFKRKCN
jgi:hypothetical protein